MIKSNQGRLLIVNDFGTGKVFAPLFQMAIPKYACGEIRKEDTVLFEGGTDVNPRFYGESRGKFTSFPDTFRDEQEINVFHEAKAVGASFIGICRGAQLLTVLSNGKLIQDVTGHGSSHEILTDKGKVLFVTSTHHQMCYPFNLPSKEYTLKAWASPTRSSSYLNGENLKLDPPLAEPEIIWYPKTRSLCIQGHPEYMKYNAEFPNYCRELIQKYIIGEL